MPISAIRAARVIPGMRTDYRRWWRSAAYDNPPSTLGGATDLLRESARRFIEIGSQHALISLVGQALAEQLELLAEKAWDSRAGSPDLMTGYGRWKRPRRWATSGRSPTTR